MSWCVFGVYALLTRLLFRPPCSMTEGSFAEEDLVVNQPPGHDARPALAGRQATDSISDEEVGPSLVRPSSVGRQWSRCSVARGGASALET